VEDGLFVLLAEGGDGGVEGVGGENPDCLGAVDFVVVGFASVLVFAWGGC
jgi:hypothetical protein